MHKNRSNGRVLSSPLCRLLSPKDRQDAVGITPATWVEEARVSAARNLLERGQEAPKQVATHCGFADADTLRRAFVRHVGVTPAEYRKRFAHIAAA